MASEIDEKLGKIDKNTVNIGKLSEEKANKNYVILVFEELKQLILNGDTDGVVAVLDQAILDL